LSRCATSNVYAGALVTALQGLAYSTLGLLKHVYPRLLTRASLERRRDSLMVVLDGAYRLVYRVLHALGCRLSTLSINDETSGLLTFNDGRVELATKHGYIMYEADRIEFGESGAALHGYRVVASRGLGYAIGGSWVNAVNVSVAADCSGRRVGVTLDVGPDALILLVKDDGCRLELIAGRTGVTVEYSGGARIECTQSGCMWSPGEKPECATKSILAAYALLAGVRSMVENTAV